MADLMGGTTTWATGTPDTASTLANGVDEKRAQHINGPASFIVSLQAKLGAAASLIGNFVDLAARLAVNIDADGVLTSAMPGDIKLSARSASTGWLPCDGAAVSRSTFSVLFAAIGTTYGAGDGSTTFNVPDMRGRVPVGTGTGVGGGASGTGLPAGGAALAAVSRATWKGEEAHLLTGPESGINSHAHTVTDPGHTHTVLLYAADGGSTQASYGTGATNPVGPAGTASATTGLTVNTIADANADTAHNTIQPVLGVTFWIKT